MREITDHKVNNFNRDHVGIYADLPERPDEAPNKYRVMLRGLDNQLAEYAKLVFHKGPLVERLPHGEYLRRPPAGLSVEALLAVCLDRLREWQKLPCACKFNDAAIKGVTAALKALGGRGEDRAARGVEGTPQP